MATRNKQARPGGKMQAFSRFSDSQLVWLYNETGRRDYFSELFMRYLPLLYGAALKYIPVEEQAKAAVKRLYDHTFEEFDKTEFYGDTFRDWLYVGSLQFFEDYVRENRIDERRFFSAATQSALSEGANRCAAILDRADSEAHRMVESARGVLTRPEQTCLTMFFLKRKSFRSIASSTGYLAGAVKKYVESALEKIGSRYEREYEMELAE